MAEVKKIYCVFDFDFSGTGMDMEKICFRKAYQTNEDAEAACNELTLCPENNHRFFYNYSKFLFSGKV